MADPVAMLLEKLDGVRRSGTGWVARCPAHEDRHASLSVAAGDDGRALVNCHAGCTTESVVGAVGQTMADLFPPSETPHRASRKRSPHLATIPPVTPVTPLQVVGLTISALATAKRLNPATLAARGVRDVRRDGIPAIAIPYRDADRNIVAIRFRDGSGFTWRSGDHVLLYGLERLAEIRRGGWVLLVEGESDSWTADEHGIPALGIPGKATWQPKWAECVAGLDVVLWQEPDAPDLVERVAANVSDLRVIVAPDGTKDISDAHVAGMDVRTMISTLRASAVPAAELIAARRATAAAASLPGVTARAAPVFAVADPLEMVRDAIGALGYGGDCRPAVLTYLAMTTRLLRHRVGAMPAHLLLVGPPSGGKSYTVDLCLRLLPRDAYHKIDAASPRVLIYDDVDLRHRVVIFGESDSLPAGEDNPAASAIRALLQDGVLSYKVTVRDPGTGDFVVKTIDRPGPTVLVTTAVRRLGPQLDSRLFVLDVPDDQAHLSHALATQARIELDGSAEADDREALVAYQELLGARAPWDVVVPFAGRLAELLGRNPVAPRITRDFARLIALIKAAAVLRHRTRVVDTTGRIVADRADYATVRELVADAYVSSTTGASARIRATVEAVTKTLGEGIAPSVTDVAARLGLNKMAASRRVRAAIAGGFLINEEERRGYPARLKEGDALPATDGLPSADELAEGDRNTVTASTDGYLGGETDLVTEHGPAADPSVNPAGGAGDLFPAVNGGPAADWNVLDPEYARDDDVPPLWSVDP